MKKSSLTLIVLATVVLTLVAVAAAMHGTGFMRELGPRLHGR